MLLCKVAEAYHNNGGEDLGYGGENMQSLNKQFNEYIIQQNTNHHQQKITK